MDLARRYLGGNQNNSRIDIHHVSGVFGVCDVGVDVKTKTMVYQEMNQRILPSNKTSMIDPRPLGLCSEEERRGG